MRVFRTLVLAAAFARLRRRRGGCCGFTIWRCDMSCLAGALGSSRAAAEATLAALEPGNNIGMTEVVMRATFMANSFQ